MSKAQAITQHFGGDWHGNYGAFPTPGHSKADRGMTVRDKADAPDGVLINTMNGGNPLEVKDECRRLGLLPERERASTIGGSWTETGSYDYRDAAGNVVYRTVRLEKPGEKKRFVAKRADGSGGWVNGLGDIDRVPYRLPDVLAADASAPIYLVEGEKKADKLAGWGLIATAVAFGCKGWRREYADPLAGRTVVILPDNDHVGRGFAERAAESIRAAGGRPCIVELPGLREGGDIIDWSGTADDLAALVDVATKAPPSKLLRLINPAAWIGTVTPSREWALHEWIPAGQATYLTGPGSAGKSLLTQQLCTCIALGLPFMGIETHQAIAVYITCEPAASLASEIRDIVGMSRRRSLGIASDQLTKLSAALDRERATEAGLRRYTWRHSAKRHPRPVHVARNGEVFAYNEPPSDGPPGSLPYCGCRAQAKIELD